MYMYAHICINTCTRLYIYAGTMRHVHVVGVISAELLTIKFEGLDHFVHGFRLKW